MYVPETFDYTAALPMRFDDGPFALAMARADSGWIHRAHYHPATGGSGMFFGSGRSIGRAELWIKPRTSPTKEPFRLAFDTWGGSVVASVDFHMSTAGQLILTVVNGAVTRTVNGPTITPNNAWHQVGVSWDDISGYALFNADSVITEVAFTPTTVTSGASSFWTLTADFRDPAAELVVADGTSRSTPWQPFTWPQKAICDRLQNRNLQGVVPTDGDNTWDVLTELVAAERGLLFVDVDGRPNIWSRARLNTADALTPTRTITS